MGLKVKRTGELDSSHLVVVHFHLRPGGVRRVIEMALPEIVRAGGVPRVTLLVGEGGAEGWVAGLRAEVRAAGAELELVVDARCGYGGGVAEAAVGTDRMRGGIGAGDVVWAHNLGLGRNLWLAREAVRWAEAGARVVSHHHDFWFENRWARWGEMRAGGGGSLEEIGNVIFSPALRHVVINGLDARGLEGAEVWPNPVSRLSGVDDAAAETTTRRCLRERWGINGEYWVAATRSLRRKNLAEAVLLHRWLRPEGWLVTTAGVSSAAESGYARALDEAAREGGWRVRFSVLAGDGGIDEERRCPTVEEVVGAAEAVVMTSVQEGFGLPYLEAAAAGKPLVARRLPNVMPDLEGWGLGFPQSYEEVWVAAGLLDLEAEAGRQAEIFARWCGGLPDEVRGMATEPQWFFAEDSELMKGLTPRVATPRVAFGRLTLAGQLEVLAVDPELSWAACAGLNPELVKWMGELRPTRWPAGVEAELGVGAYAGRFWDLFSHDPARSRGGGELQTRMIGERLGAGYLFPILME